MIKIQYILIFIIITSSILPIQYQTLILVNGQIQKESNLIIYDKDKSEHKEILSHPDDSMLVKVDVKIEGTFLNDTMKGGEGNDVIDGGKGDDILDGKGGNDKIQGGGGSDRISGEIGNDQLVGERGEDMLMGGEGKDFLDGGEGNDVIFSGKGADMITGGIGSDTFICDENDILVDFNSNEKDNIIGSCSTEYLAENKEEKEANELKETQIEKIHGDNNIFPVELTTSKFEKMSKPLQSSLKSPQQSESLKDFNTPSSQISKGFEKIEPSSTKPSKEFDIPIPLPHANIQSSSNHNKS